MFGVYYYYLYLCFGQIPGDTWNNLSWFTVCPPSFSCPLFLGSVQCSTILLLDHIRTFSVLMVKGIFGMVKLPLTLALTDIVCLDESCRN